MLSSWFSKKIDDFNSFESFWFDHCFEELILNSSQRLKKEIVLLESIDTFRTDFLAVRVIAILDVDERLNDFLTKQWIAFWLDIEVIELMWKDSRFAQKVDMISKDSRMRRMFRVLIDQRFDFLTQRRSFWFDLWLRYDVFLMI